MEQLAGMAPIDLWLDAMAAKAKEKGELDDHWGRVDKPHTPPARAVSQKRAEPSPLTKAPEVDAADITAQKKDRKAEVVAAAAAAGGDDVAPEKEKAASRTRNIVANEKAASRLRAPAIRSKYPVNIAETLKETVLREIDDPSVISELCEATNGVQLRASVKPCFRLVQ